MKFFCLFDFEFTKWGIFFHIFDRLPIKYTKNAKIQFFKPHGWSYIKRYEAQLKKKSEGVEKKSPGARYQKIESLFWEFSNFFEI